MGIKIKILSIILGLVFLLLVLRLIKKNHMRPAYAVLWVFVALFLISIPFLEFFYVWLAYSVIGIIDARNIIYIGLIGFLLCYIFYLSIRISRMSDQIQTLVSFLAILENKLRKSQKDKLEIME
ncbi:MAG: DUF2304 domain-containing protein [Candidatus Aminicenantes bacterium]|nr:DUF2304 domain-containing protein [Candidatus Aminicenantes bacterium]